MNTGWHNICFYPVMPFYLLVPTLFSLLCFFLPVPSRGPKRFALLPLFGLWGWFYLLDLQYARFAWMLLLVPAGAVIGIFLGNWRRAVIGGLFGLTLVWYQMIGRSDNGCTGVSGIYTTVLLFHPLLLVWPSRWFLVEKKPCDNS